jgi:hypothetical protein
MERPSSVVVFRMVDALYWNTNAYRPSFSNYGPIHHESSTSIAGVSKRHEAVVGVWEPVWHQASHAHYGRLVREGGQNVLGGDVTRDIANKECGNVVDILTDEALSNQIATLPRGVSCWIVLFEIRKRLGGLVVTRFIPRHPVLVRGVPWLLWGVLMIVVPVRPLVVVLDGISTEILGLAASVGVLASGSSHIRCRERGSLS